MFTLRKKKFRLPVLILFLFTLAAFLIGGLKGQAAPVDEEIQIEVTGGFDGIAKLGAWAPMQVKINSSSRNIIGEIQVEANLDQSRKIIIAKPIALNAGTGQQLYFEIPVVSANRKVNIRFVEGKKTLAQEEFSFTRLLPPEIMLIGVLSEDPEAFGWLNGNTVPILSGDIYSDEKMKLMMAAGQMSRSSVPQPMTDEQVYKNRQAVVVSLDRDNFPEKTEVIDGFDYLFINKFDTALLSEAQLSTMETWVNTGGVLLLGTGMNWQKVYHGLPESFQLFSIDDTQDVSSASMLKSFTGKDTPEMTLRLAKGRRNFEYIPISAGDVNYNPGQPNRYFDNDIVAGDEQNPLVIKYRKEMGSVLVFTFDPAAEPFNSWMGKVAFFENTLKYVNISMQRFYEQGNGFYQKQYYNSNNLQYLATEVPSDKKPPFVWMFSTLAVYIILAGPVLYMILKKLDKRDWAWVCIPALSILFLGSMYLLGFKSRYHSAVMNTVSLIQVSPDGNEASVSSTIGVFNDRRGTLKLEYSGNNGMKTPFIQNNEYMNYRYNGNTEEGRVVGKYTMDEPITFEQYDVMLWTPMMLTGEKIIPFNGDILKDLSLSEGKLTGNITNTSPYDLLDAVVIIGTNIIPVGDILGGDTKPMNIPFGSKEIYKRTDEYLDGVFGRSYYNNNKDIPSNFQEMMHRRRMFENYIHDVYSMQQGKTQFALLARNNQVIDYGLTINDKEPQKYNQNLIRMESDFSFQSGQEVEIPGGIILATFFQNKEVGWQEGNNGIRINTTGEMEFQFNMPEKLSVTGLTLAVENYIPLYIKYNMENNQNNNRQTEILSNQYEYSLYNVKTRSWDSIEAKTTIAEDAARYIGSGNEVRMKINVVGMGVPDSEQDYSSGMYKEYQQELLGMPEISVWGVAK